MTKEEYLERHIARHPTGEICIMCPPYHRGCCTECWHVNTAHSTSLDYCKNEDCECHTPSPEGEEKQGD